MPHVFEEAEINMINIDRLKEEWGTKTLEPYGVVIQVPGVAWRASWDEDLKKLHMEYVKTDFGNPNRPVYLIKLPGETAALPPEQEKPASSPNEQETVTEPPQKKHAQLGRWSFKDAERLGKRIDELGGSMKEKATELVPEFPGRSMESIRQKIDEITQIRKKLKTSAEQGVTDEPSGSTEAKNEENKERMTRRGRAVADRLEKELAKKVAGKSDFQAKITETLDMVVNVVDKMGCTLMMHALEMREIKAKDGFKIPGGLWVAYANALTEEDAIYSKIFRDKVQKLLEVAE